MRKSKSTETQIFFAFRQAESGNPRRQGLSEGEYLRADRFPRWAKDIKK
jgi:hypothetical protein